MPFFEPQILSFTVLWFTYFFPPLHTCSGVNMYAMLTGCLPYTVEPFNITALHAKMLENKMNPIPDHLSASESNNYGTCCWIDPFYFGEELPGKIN